MATAKCTCPECNLTFPAPATASGQVVCPICDTPFRLSSTAVTAPPALARAAASAAPAAARPTAQPAAGWSGDQRLILLHSSVLALVILGGVVAGIALLRRDRLPTGIAQQQAAPTKAQSSAIPGQQGNPAFLPPNPSLVPPPPVVPGPVPAPPVDSQPKLEVRVIEITKSQEQQVPKRWQIAVSHGEYDDMGRLLQQLGDGYKYTPRTLEDLVEPGKISSFDVLFACCGSYPKSWLTRFDQPGIGNVNPKIVERIRENLRGWVGKGGTLYASDHMFWLLAMAFPELIGLEWQTGAGAQQAGAIQELQARVVDPGLRELIGNQLPLRFDLVNWFPAVLKSPKITVYLEGTYRTVKGNMVAAPLLVKVPFEQGSIIFTSFHNEKQNSERELQLLRYIVFAAVTARIDATVTQTLVSGGFSPSSKKQFSLSPDAQDSPQATQTYENKNPGRLRFALGFPDQGAKLRLTLVSPTGQKAEREGTSAFALEVPNAAAGKWQYTVTALTVPYANFPFTLTVGEPANP